MTTVTAVTVDHWGHCGECLFDRSRLQTGPQMVFPYQIPLSRSDPSVEFHQLRSSESWLSALDHGALLERMVVQVAPDG